MTPTEIAKALKEVTHTTYEEHSALVDACDCFMTRMGTNDRAKQLFSPKKEKNDSVCRADNLF